MPENQNDLHRVGAAIKYNPHLWSAEELRSIFIARKKELQQILDIITQTEVSIAPQHTLITGQRGMGKSTLLQRVALAIEEDEGLSKVWLPLRFPEEQYTVTTLAELWKNVLNSLADTLEEQPEKQQEIDSFLDKLEKEEKEKQEKKAIAFLQEWCEKNQIRLLLLMDSTDLLLSNLSHSGKKKKSDAGASQLWQLRDTLQNNPCFFWLGGSYQPIDADALYHDTFLDFFYNVELKPLTLKEMRDTMKELAKAFGIGRDLKGKKAVKEIERIFNEYPARLKVLRRLSGGNLRTTVMLYELLSAGGDDNVQADLKRLLDLMTPLYKSRMEALADQPRKILAHLFEHWAPISLGELADISGLEKSSLSPQLQRLELEGLIEKTQLPNTSRKGYQVTERFFNIWYLMRNAPRRLRLRLNYLISFMRLWFNTEELTSLALRQNNKHINGGLVSLQDCEYSRAIALALPEQSTLKHQLEWNAFKLARRDFKDKLNDLFDLQGKDKPFATSADYIERLEALPTELKKLSFKVTKKEMEEWVHNVISSPSLSLDEKEAISKSSSKIDYEQFIEQNEFLSSETNKYFNKYGKDACHYVLSKISAGDFFPDCPDSELTYKQIINCFSGNNIAFLLALDLFGQKHQDRQVEKAYIYMIKENPNEPAHWNNFGNFLQGYLKRFKDAEKAYREAIALDPNNTYPWNGLGNLFTDHLGRYEEGEKAYRKAIELDPNNSHPWNGLGILFTDHLGRYEEGEKAYRKAIELDPDNAYAWSGLGSVLGYLNQYLEAETAYKRAIFLDPNFSSPWGGLGYIFTDFLKKHTEAEQAYQKAIELDPNDSYPWKGLGYLFLHHLKRHEDAEHAYQKAIKIDPNNGLLWNDLGNLFTDHLKQYDKAEKAFRQFVILDENHPYGYANLARLLILKGEEKQIVEKLYRTVIEKTENNYESLLQAYLYLGNKDLASHALDQLVKNAENGNPIAFSKIKVQCYLCYTIDLGSSLAELMETSIYASFLQPFILALKAADGDEQALLAAPVEVADMAREVMLEIQK